MSSAFEARAIMNVQLVRCDGESVDAALDYRHGESVPARIKDVADGNKLDPRSVYSGVPVEKGDGPCRQDRLAAGRRSWGKEQPPFSTHSEDSRLGRRASAIESRKQAILPPHLDAAYSLARWLTATEQDAEDGGCRKLACARSGSLRDTREGLPAPGCYRLSAAPATRGWPKIGNMKRR